MFEGIVRDDYGAPRQFYWSLMLYRRWWCYILHPTGWIHIFLGYEQGMGNRILRLQYIGNILQYMQYCNILLPEANIAIYIAPWSEYCNIYCLARERLQYTGNIRFPISGLSYSVTELWMSGNTDWWMMMQRKFIQMKAYWLVDVSGSYCSLKISIAVTYSSVKKIIIYIWQ